MADSKIRLESDAGLYWQGVDSDKIKGYAHWQEHFLKGPDNWRFRGQRMVHIVNSMLKRAQHRWKHQGRMVDWGCGGGMAAIWFGKLYKEYFGVDICQRTLDECQRQITENATPTDFYPVHIDIQQPENIFRTVTPESVDFFLSTSCFQHFPHIDYARRILTICNCLLRHRGLAMIQVRWWDGSSYYATKDSNYCKGKNAIRFLSFDPLEFFEICEAMGFKVLAKQSVPRVNYAYYLLAKRHGVAKLETEL